MTSALIWGVIAASSLFIGGRLGIVRPWPARLVGAVLAFGGGALISGISYELFAEGLETGGPVALGIGLAAGALTY